MAQPFEGFLPYDDFSVRVREEDIPKLPEMLQDLVTAGMVPGMQVDSPPDCVNHPLAPSIHRQSLSSY
jgi:hypothetical protein